MILLLTPLIGKSELDEKSRIPSDISISALTQYNIESHVDRNTEEEGPVSG